MAQDRGRIRHRVVHAGVDGSHIAYAGLVAFVILSVYLETRSSPKNIDAPRLASRLLIPWIFWFLFYAALNVAAGKQPIDSETGEAILSGPRPHMWYLPFIFMVIVGLRSLRKKVSDDALYFAAVMAFALFIWFCDDWRPWTAWRSG